MHRRDTARVIGGNPSLTLLDSPSSVWEICRLGRSRALLACSCQKRIAGNQEESYLYVEE
jgi:hypothetical protein